MLKIRLCITGINYIAKTVSLNCYDISQFIFDQINAALLSMNELCILYSALLSIVVHPKRFTIMGGGVSPQPLPVCSIHLDYVTAATVQRCQCAHHTPATGGERVIEPIKWLGVIRRP